MSASIHLTHTYYNYNSCKKSEKSKKKTKKQATLWDFFLRFPFILWHLLLHLECRCCALFSFFVLYFNQEPHNHTMWLKQECWQCRQRLCGCVCVYILSTNNKKCIYFFFYSVVPRLFYHQTSVGIFPYQLVALHTHQHRFDVRGELTNKKTAIRTQDRIRNRKKNRERNSSNDTTR